MATKYQIQEQTQTGNWKTVARTKQLDVALAMAATWARGIRDNVWANVNPRSFRVVDGDVEIASFVK